MDPRRCIYGGICVVVLVGVITTPFWMWRAQMQTWSRATTECDAESVELSDSQQWLDEKGYWLGEYTLIGANGDTSTSASWNYKYDHYKGFITGDIHGNRYSQRNIFIYPPQDPAVCSGGNDPQGVPGTAAVQGAGVCGVNGNIKVFEADQEATTCDTGIPGAIEGPYGSMSYTYSTMVGKDNAVLYQVYLTEAAQNNYAGMMGVPGCTAVSQYEFDCGIEGDKLMQSQLTTLSPLTDGGIERVRTAQGFNPFGPLGPVPSYASYYRETKVTKEEFYQAFDDALVSNNILESDYGTWKSAETGGNAATGCSGLQFMTNHLESAFVWPFEDKEGAAKKEGCGP